MSADVEPGMPGDIVVVVSDLHLGAGRAHDGNVLEDFSSDAAFAALLAEIARESEATGRGAELVLNGDVVEFLQVPRAVSFEPGQTYPASDYADTSPSASAQRLQFVVEGHAAVFDALRDWIRAEPPRRRLVVTRGNHDPHWYWSSVQDVLRQAIGANDEKRTLLQFAALGYKRGGLYVEHGNQYAEAANRFNNPAAPLAAGNPTQLETPWGSKFVFEFFNIVERERYWVDGVKPTLSLIWYALKYDAAFAFRALVALLRAAPRLAGIRDEIRDSWLTNLQTNPEFAAQRYRTSAVYRAEVHTLVAHAMDELEPAAARAEVTGDDDPRQMAVAMQEEQERRLVDAATRLAEAQQAALVLLGHTHRAVDMELRNGARYINTGCWVWQMDLANASDNQWRTLFAHPDPYAAQRQLNYARIDYDESGAPAAQLLEFQPSSAVELPAKRPNLFERLSELLQRIITGVKEIFSGEKAR